MKKIILTFGAMLFIGVGVSMAQSAEATTQTAPAVEKSCSKGGKKGKACCAATAAAQETPGKACCAAAASAGADAGKHDCHAKSANAAKTIESKTTGTELPVK